jgi:hypothetical protein
LDTTAAAGAQAGGGGAEEEEKEEEGRRAGGHYSVSAGRSWTPGLEEGAGAGAGGYAVRLEREGEELAAAPCGRMEVGECLM